MPQQAWSAKRERQYKHIKEGLIDNGTKEEKVEEIAARTVNKARARSGEAATSSRLSREDISSAERASHRRKYGGRGRTFEQLYEEARQMGIRGRSKMNKRELQNALSAKKS